MANYSTLKAAVADVVKTNGNQAITGANLQSVLLSIINSVGGGGYIFKGAATPSTSAGTPDENVFYIGGAGTYANFGTSITVPVGSICVFKYNGSWAKEQIALFAGIDDVPTAGSNNLVKSGGVYDKLLQLQNNAECFIYSGTFTSAFYKPFNETVCLKKGEVLMFEIDSLTFTGTGVAVYFRTEGGTNLSQYITSNISQKQVIKKTYDEDKNIVGFGISVNSVQSLEITCRFSLGVLGKIDTITNRVATCETDILDIKPYLSNIPDNGMCFYKYESYNGSARTITLDKHIFVKKGMPLKISGNITSLSTGASLAFFFRKTDNSYIQKNVTATGTFEFEHIAATDLEISSYGVIISSSSYSFSGYCEFSANIVAAFDNVANSVTKLQLAQSVFINSVDTKEVAKSGTASTFKGFIVNKSYTATGNGAIKKLYFYSPAASNAIKFVVCSKGENNNVFTIKSVYDYTLSDAGLNELNVTIPVEKDDYFGVFASAAANMLNYSASTTDGWYWQTASTENDIVVGNSVSAAYLSNFSLGYGFFAAYEKNNNDVIYESVVATRNSADYNSIREIVSGLDANKNHQYKIIVPNGEWFECDLQGKKYVEIIGQDRDKTILYCDGTSNKLTPSNYSYSGKENTPLNQLETTYKHVFFIKHDCFVKNLTIRVNNCKYCAHLDTGSYEYAYFENCVFYDYASNNYPVGIGIRGGQEIQFNGCVFKTSTTGRKGIFAHNWNNQDNPSKILVKDCLFDNAGFMNIDELGSEQDDDWKLLNCYSNVGGSLNFMVDKNGDGDTYYTNPSTGLKEPDPQDVPYSIKLNCLGSNVVSSESSYFNGNVQAVARPDFAKYLVTDHYVKTTAGTYVLGAVVRKVLTGALVDYSEVLGVVEYIIDGFAYIAKNTVWLNSSNIQGTPALNALVYEDANGLVSVTSSANQIGKIIAYRADSDTYQIVLT